jgi:DNA adenine methylase
MTKPFLKWAGGKRWLLNYLDEIIGNSVFNNYHEPFLGGGAIFFSLEPQNNVYLSDLNEELINTYSMVQKKPRDIIKILNNYTNTKEFYYQIRQQKIENDIERAARFIYLNKTAYNGLYRVNRRGEFNVPYGKGNGAFLNEDKILKASLSLQNAHINWGDFSNNRNYIKEGDLVFLDPPYTVSNKNNCFIEYNQTLFSLEDQRRLSRYIDYIKEQGAFYILTNAAHPTILELFEKGDKLLQLNRKNLIGGEHANRGVITEYVFTNIGGL